MGSSNLANFLIADGILSPKQGNTLTYESGNSSGAFAKSLIANGTFNEQNLARYIAKKTNFPFNRKLLLFPRGRAENILPLPIIRKLEIVPMSIEGNTLTVALADPLDQGVMEQLRFFTGMKISPVVVTFSAIARSLQKQIPDFELSPPPLSKATKEGQVKGKKKVRKKKKKLRTSSTKQKESEESSQETEPGEPSLRKPDKEEGNVHGLTEELPPGVSLEDLMADDAAKEEETQVAQDEMNTITEAEEAAAPLVDEAKEIEEVTPIEVPPEEGIEPVEPVPEELEGSSAPPSLQVDPAIGYLNHAIAITNLSFSKDKALEAAEHGFQYTGIPQGAIYALGQEPPSLLLQWGSLRTSKPLPPGVPENIKVLLQASTLDAWVPIREIPDEWTFMASGDAFTLLLLRLKVAQREFSVVASWLNEKRKNSTLLKLSMKLLEELIKKYKR